MKILNLLAVATLALIGLNACSKDCNHDFIEHDYSDELVGTWSVIGEDHAYAIVIYEDGTLDYTSLDEGEFYKGTARYQVVNNRMTIIWDDGAIDEGRLNIVEGNVFSMIIDEETGAGYYFSYCHEDLSDELIGSWLVQTDETSEIHGYYEDGTTDCRAYYYHLEEQYETFVTGTYNLVGNILFDNVLYAEDIMYSFASCISYTPNGSPFGDVLTSKSYSANEDGLEESATPAIRVKPYLDLAGNKYNYSDCNVTNVKGDDIEIDFMGYSFNFAKMDGSGLDVMLKTLFFNVEFPNADTLYYSYQLNKDKETFKVPIVVEDNKMTIKMSNNVPTLKDVVFYTFQSIDCEQLHLCMDKTAFVNFYTNMQAMLMQVSDEQFDITNTDSVNAIYNNINNAVQTIKLTIEMTNSAN